MQVVNFPEGYQQIMPYLIVSSGNAFKAFVEAVFGATEKYTMMGDDGDIRHGEVQIGESTIMFSTTIEGYGVQPAGLFVYVANADEAYAKALQHGAISIEELSDRHYGRTCGVKDPFGNTWWITTHVE